MVRFIANLRLSNSQNMLQRLKSFFCTHAKGFDVLEVYPEHENWWAFADVPYLVNQGTIKCKCRACGNIGLHEDVMIKKEGEAGNIFID